MDAVADHNHGVGGLRARLALSLLAAASLLWPSAAAAHWATAGYQGQVTGTSAAAVATAATAATAAEAQWAPATSETPAWPEPAGVTDLIIDASERWGLDSQRMLRVAWCESKFDPQAYNARSRAAGLFQFVPSTWRWASTSVGLAGASPYDAGANVEAAAWLMATQGPSHWSCR